MKTFLVSFALVSVVVVGFARPVSADIVASQITDYKLLAPLPLTGADSAPTNSVSTNLDAYIQGVVKLTIGICTALAVIMIMIGGVQYVMSSSLGGKSTGRDTITHALEGLLLAICSYVILYTINPNLLSLNLKITPIPIQGISDTLADPNAPISGDDRPTDSGSNSSGAIAAGCTNNCTVMDPKAVAFTVKACSTYPNCYVNLTLYGKLAELNEDIKTFVVTEAFPPLGTVPHSSSCHAIGANSGTCVDGSISNSNDPAKVADFLKAIQLNVGPSFQWETTSAGECTKLKADPAMKGLTNYVVFNSGASGPHAHINLNGSARQDSGCGDTKAANLE